MIHFNIQGRAPKTPNDYIMAGYRVVSPGYFETLGIPLMAGRAIEQRDSLTAPSVVVLNQAMAQKFFPGENPWASICKSAKRRTLRFRSWKWWESWAT